jgi:hypothetical protein
MISIPVLPVVAGAMLQLLVVLALKLRGSRGRDDVMGPPKRRKKRISPGVAGRLIELVSAGDEGGALRMFRAAGYEEAEARQVLALVVKVENYGKPGPGVW